MKATLNGLEEEHESNRRQAAEQTKAAEASATREREAAAEAAALLEREREREKAREEARKADEKRLEQDQRDALRETQKKKLDMVIEHMMEGPAFHEGHKYWGMSADEIRAVCELCVTLIT